MTTRGKNIAELTQLASFGDRLIGDVDRAVSTVHRELGRQFHLPGYDRR